MGTKSSRWQKGGGKTAVGGNGFLYLLTVAQKKTKPQANEVFEEGWREILSLPTHRHKKQVIFSSHWGMSKECEVLTSLPSFLEMKLKETQIFRSSNNHKELQKLVLNLKARGPGKNVKCQNCQMSKYCPLALAGLRQTIILGSRAYLQNQ